MADGAKHEKGERIVLGVLHAFESDVTRSQRHVATELGIALGLVNAYVRRCVRKGLLKVSQIPAGRYTYYVTPKGFAEKSRLAAEFLTSSFEFFRTARSDLMAAFLEAKARGWTSVVLVGATEAAEVAALCSIEAGIPITAIIDPDCARPQLVGIRVVASYEEAGSFSGVIVTALAGVDQIAKSATEFFGPERVLVPSLLRAGPARKSEVAL